MDSGGTSDAGHGNFVSLAELAAKLKVSVQTIYDLRSKGRGPRGIRVGTQLRFRESEIDAWVERMESELRKLGRTLKQRATDVLAYFDRPGTSNGPTEAIKGRLEYLRGTALGFRNLTNCTARALLETGGFRPRLHPGMR